MYLRSLAFCAVATLLTAADPRLQFEPAQPHPGDMITISFDPKGGPLEKSASLTLVYGPTPIQWMRAPMQRKGDRFVAEVRVWFGTSYLWCWVEDPASGEKDTNRGMAWDTYLYDKKGFPVRDARRLRADLYQIQGQGSDKNAISLILLEEELRAFPSNGFARGVWWALRFEEAGRTNAARDKLLHEIAVFLDSNNDKPWAYQAAAEGYHRIGRTPQAVEIMRAFVKRFPEDDSLDVIVGFYFRISGNVADLESLQKASPRWAESSWYWESMFEGIYMAPGPPAPDKLQSAGEHWIAALDKNDANNARIRIRIAEVWMLKGVDPKAAERVAREAVNMSETGGVKFAKNSLPNPAITPQAFAIPIHRSTLGWALYQQNRYEEALKELERAAAIGEKEQLTMRDVYYRLGQTLERLNRSPEALDAYIKELASGNDNTLAWEGAAAAYAKIHSGSQGFREEIRSRVNDLAVNAAAALQDINEKLGRFELRRPDGQPIQMSSYAGKAVIVDFWGTWCGPCLVSLENTQKLVRQFPGKVAVLAVAVDSEETQAAAQPYLTGHGYDFVLLFDDEHRRDLTYPGVPTRLLVDGSGRLRLRQVGAGPYADLVFEQKLAKLIGEPQN